MLDDSLVGRFLASFEQRGADECWLWAKSTVPKGYGQIKLTGQRRQTYAHRVAYEWAKGPIPPHKQVCHTCDNPRCVNPAHLFVGTASDNLQDMKRKGRHLYGVKNSQSVLTDQKVKEILALSKVGVTQMDLAGRYGVSQGTISKIVLGQRWTHVT